MTKRILVCGLLMALASLASGYVVHGLLLSGDYAVLVGTLIRPPAESQRLLTWMIVAHLLIGMAVTWLYAQGFNAAKSSAGQGLRFGLAIALLAVVPMYLIYYVMQPTPVALAVKQVVFDGLRFMLLGGLVAYLHPQRASLADTR
ncbi:MAG: hypothetical protein ACREO8_05970 [Luteimonas sp.]